MRAYRRGENLKGDQYKWSKVEVYWRWALRSSSPSRVPSPKVAAAVVLEVRAERELARHPAQAQAVEALATLVHRALPARKRLREIEERGLNNGC